LSREFTRSAKTHNPNAGGDAMWNSATPAVADPNSFAMVTGIDMTGKFTNECRKPVFEVFFVLNRFFSIFCNFYMHSIALPLKSVKCG